MSDAEIVALWVHGLLVAYFLWRFIRFRFAASLGVAMLPLGWVALSLSVETFARDAVLLFGAASGAVLLVLVLLADRGDVRR